MDLFKGLTLYVNGYFVFLNLKIVSLDCLSVYWNTNQNSDMFFGKQSSWRVRVIFPLLSLFGRLDTLDTCQWVVHCNKALFIFFFFRIY